MSTMTNNAESGSPAGLSDLQVRLKYCKSETDDWTRVEDKALRKKIQNRLAKRKSRTNGQDKKGGPTSRTKEPPKKTSITTESALSDVAFDVHTLSTAAGSLLQKRFIRTKVLEMITAAGLTEHRYLRLVQYSLLRALVENAQLLAIDPVSLADDESLSPWTLANPYPTLAPHDLSPTTIQLRTPHHPYLDMVASPSVRDNILVAMLRDEQEDQLCYDLHIDSFTIWGSQPWNSRGWEVSQTFVDKWAWLLDDESIRCSNFWRAERGEEPLILPFCGGSILGELA